MDSNDKRQLDIDTIRESIRLDDVELAKSGMSADERAVIEGDRKRLLGMLAERLAERDSDALKAVVAGSTEGLL